jgi:hypothetical protein
MLNPIILKIFKIFSPKLGLTYSKQCKKNQIEIEADARV